MAVRNDQIFELLQTMHSDLGEVKVRLGRMNGRLDAAEGVVRELPCADHRESLAVLKERVGSQGVNWSRVINVAMTAGQTLFILWLVSNFVF